MEKNKLKKYFSNNIFQEAVFFLLMSVFLLVYSLVKHYGGVKIEWKMSPYLFPIIIAVFLFILSFVLLAQALKKINTETEQKKEKEYFNVKNFVFTIAIAFLYYFSMHYISFVIATILLITIMLLLFGERRWWMIVLVSLLTTGIIYAIFSIGLKVNLP